jgi:hypothetical protein
MSILLIGICTNFHTTPLEESCKHFGVPLLMTQRGEPWVSFRQNKMINLRRDLEKREWESVLYMDANDSFITRATVLQETEELLLRHPFVISGESNCYPWPNRHGPYYTSDKLLKYPNAGIWAAKREAYTTVLDWALQWHDDYVECGRAVSDSDDQLYHHEFVQRGMAVVEESGRWCLNLYGLTDRQIDEQLTLRPAIIHGSSYENKRRVTALYKRLIDARANL